jgi:hypothetical protein
MRLLPASLGWFIERWSLVHATSVAGRKRIPTTNWYHIGYVSRIV